MKVARRGGYIGAPLVRLLKVETREGLMHFVGNLGKVQSKAGLRGALDVLKVAEHPKDVAKLARLADAKGTKTRAIVKLLGRGAIVLTGALFDLALWVFWALFNLSGVLRGLQARGGAHDAAPLRAAAHEAAAERLGSGRGGCLNGGGFPSRRQDSCRHFETETSRSPISTKARAIRSSWCTALPPTRR